MLAYSHRRILSSILQHHRTANYLRSMLEFRRRCRSVMLLLLLPCRRSRFIRAHQCQRSTIRCRAMDFHVLRPRFLPRHHQHMILCLRLVRHRHLQIVLLLYVLFVLTRSTLPNLTAVMSANSLTEDRGIVACEAMFSSMLILCAILAMLLVSLIGTRRSCGPVWVPNMLNLTLWIISSCRSPCGTVYDQATQCSSVSLLKCHLRLLYHRACNK